MKKLLLFILTIISIQTTAQVGIRSKDEVLTISVDSTTSEVAQNQVKVTIYSLEGKKTKEALVNYSDSINGKKTFELRVYEQPKGIFIINILIDDKTFKRLYINE